jgi:Transmembrane secretion effector
VRPVGCVRSSIASRPKVSRLPLESYFESVISAIRYVRYSHSIRIILIRNAIFSFFIAIIPALLPAVGLKELHMSPSNLGLIFASMGIGSVLTAVFILPWARAHFSPNTSTRLAALLLSTASPTYRVTQSVRRQLVVFAGRIFSMLAKALPYKKADGDVIAQAESLHVKPTVKPGASSLKRALHEPRMGPHPRPLRPTNVYWTAVGLLLQCSPTLCYHRTLLVQE